MNTDGHGYFKCRVQNWESSEAQSGGLPNVARVALRLALQLEELPESSPDESGLRSADTHGNVTKEIPAS